MLHVYIQHVETAYRLLAKVFDAHAEDKKRHQANATAKRNRDTTLQW